MSAAATDTDRYTPISDNSHSVIRLNPECACCGTHVDHALNVGLRVHYGRVMQYLLCEPCAHAFRHGDQLRVCFAIDRRTPP